MNIDRKELLLDSIRDATRSALAFTQEMEFEEFLDDERTRMAVSMCLLVIGENVARLAQRHPEFVASHPNVPWAQAVGMRNRIAHGYNELDFDIVWRTVRDYLPELIRSLDG